MAKEKRIVLDTNIFIFDFANAGEKRQNIENFILQNLREKDEYRILISKELENQILNVAKRVKDKDWAGLVQFLMWRDYNLEYVFIEHVSEDIKRFINKIPKKDIIIFFTALIGKAECLVSNNREFMKKSALAQRLFKCYEPNEFVNNILNLNFITEG